MDLSQLKTIFESNGCEKIYVKVLSANDNSKNQVYFGSSFEILNILPISEIRNEVAGNWEKERFKASINFHWIGEDGHLYLAPNSQLILYPKYPEVRFSGFLQNCENAPSKLMTKRLANRLLFFSVTKNGIIIGYVADPNSLITNEFNHLNSVDVHGVFKIIELNGSKNKREILLSELLRIHQLGWIKSKSLTKNGVIVPCESSNCGGYTLEAELGIIRNGVSDPDFLGWEIKSFGVNNFNNINSKVITLFTPEPTNGLYKLEGVEYFLRKYGYYDKKGREDRINFGGVHKVGIKQSLTNLELKLIGFDEQSGKIRNTDGRVALIDLYGNEAASWSFLSMLKHWNNKHNQACYIPSLLEKSNERHYQYGSKIILGTGTDFQLFLSEMAKGNIYYDPGIKMENESTKPIIKKRSQFRIKSGNLSNLYKVNEIIDLTI